MDRQNREGSKAGSGGLISSQLAELERRERLKKLALETIDLGLVSVYVCVGSTHHYLCVCVCVAKDPYFHKNPNGKFECRLCLTTHPSGSFHLLTLIFLSFFLSFSLLL